MPEWTEYHVEEPVSRLFSRLVCQLLGGCEKPVSATLRAPSALHGRDQAIFAEFQM